MASRILVTGGTGTLGREVVGRLAGSGPVVRVLSRRPRPAGRAADTGAEADGDVEWAVGDLGTGEGVDAAVRDVGTIVHCATDLRRGRKNLPGVRRFLRTARDAGVAHLVYISIVGVDRVPLGYYRVKLTEERLVEESGLPWTTLRATQFHELVRLLLATLARLPVLVVPAGVRDQPVDVRTVASRLAELATGPPAGRVADLGGPEVLTFEELARTYLQATGTRRPVLPVRLPGAVYRGYRDGGHLTPDHAGGGRTFAEYLAEQVRAAPDRLP